MTKVLMRKKIFIHGIPVQHDPLFYTLVINSLKFCEADPLIDIFLDVPAASELKAAGVDQKKKSTKLIFKDNGVGFEQMYSRQIFTLLQRLNDRQKFGGTGIGLAVCKKRQALPTHSWRTVSQGKGRLLRSICLWLRQALPQAKFNRLVFRQAGFDKLVSTSWFRQAQPASTGSAQLHRLSPDPQAQPSSNILQDRLKDQLKG